MFKLKKQSGFSLLEILIAMAIMAIMVAVALPNLSGSSDKLAKQEIFRLVAAIELVRDQSILLNREFGLTIDDKGYQFLELVDDDGSDSKSGSDQKIGNKDGNNNSNKNLTDGKRKPKVAEWQEISEFPELGRHEFAEGLEINLTLDEENLFSSFDDEVNIFEEEIDIFEEDDKSEKKLDPPQIYFLSSGEQNQFSIGIAVSDKNARNDERYFFRVRGFLTGELKYEGPLEGNLFQDLDRNFEKDEF
ncbi:MAG: type II secretion system protein GspH [Gammaproteobacteria bacterium]|nr:MAG: type II secretion system protein GspH [Gammaproteobacteria bacterium]